MRPSGMFNERAGYGWGYGSTISPPEATQPPSAIARSDGTETLRRWMSLNMEISLTHLMRPNNRAQPLSACSDLLGGSCLYLFR
jgi:hypothetical protein